MALIGQLAILITFKNFARILEDSCVLSGSFILYVNPVASFTIIINFLDLVVHWWPPEVSE